MKHSTDTYQHAEDFSQRITWNQKAKNDMKNEEIKDNEEQQNKNKKHAEHKKGHRLFLNN